MNHIWIFLPLSTNFVCYISHSWKSSSEAHSEPCQTSKMELFATIINKFPWLNIFVKCSIFDIRQVSGCALAVSTKRKQRHNDLLIERLITVTLYRDSMVFWKILPAFRFSFNKFLKKTKGYHGKLKLLAFGIWRIIWI